MHQSMLGAQPAYDMLSPKGRTGVNYAKHGHAFTENDWAAMVDFFDENLLGKKVDRTFDRFPTELELDTVGGPAPARRCKSRP
jgi:hypothetical protein